MPSRIFALFHLCLFCLPAFAQKWEWPDSSKNLKALPKDTNAANLREAMREYSMSLGMRCHDCHVGEDRKPLSSYDFESDEKKVKETTREMIRMVDQINATLAKLPEKEGGRAKVRCMTCHHGVREPKPLESLLQTTYQNAGLEKTMQQYEELRKEYYGSFAYDFQELPLYRVAQDLADHEKIDDAISFLQLNLSHNPDSAASLNLLGDLKLKKGDPSAARAAWEKTLALQNWNLQVKEKLEKIDKTETQPKK